MLYVEPQTQSAKVFALPRHLAHLDIFKYTPQPLCTFPACFPLLWIRINLDKHNATAKRAGFKTQICVVAWCWNHLDEPTQMAGPKSLPTDFLNHHRLESCVA